MPTLKEKLKSAQFLYFADPIHFAGQYYPNRVSVIVKSDYDFFKPYIKNWSGQSKYKKELSELSDLERMKLRLFDGTYSIIVPDNIINNKQKLDKFFRAEDFISGPRVDLHSGKYLEIDGDDSMRLDIFGQKLEIADFRFFSRNREHIGGNKIYIRSISFQAEQDGIYENIRVLENKSKYLLIADYEENGSNADSYGFFEDGELNESSGIVFVQDLEDNVEIHDAIIDWHDSYMRGISGEWRYSEDDRLSKVKYKNPIKITSYD